MKGVRFDPDIPQTIRLEFAKSNTKVSKPKQQNSSPPAAAPHPTLLHPLTGREYHKFHVYFCLLLIYCLSSKKTKEERDNKLNLKPISLSFYNHHFILFFFFKIITSITLIDFNKHN
jgi:hypothetical protein